MDIKITQTQHPKQKPDQNKLGFGAYTTDHMLLMRYENGSWQPAEIVPYDDFKLDPATIVFHYAQECFEGMKAYRRPDGEVQLFRPEKNAQRMQSTHQRLCMPEIPEDVFVNAVRALVSLDKGWVPSVPDASLYIRPTTIATDKSLGVHPSQTYLFFIICSPSGPYYEEGLDPVKIYVEDELTRAAPGGTGHIKCGGNYAAGLAAQEKAARLGYSQVLWLDGVERRFVEEVGAMNCFFKVDGEIVTAPAGGTVLPGITRMSCLDLLREWGVPVREERIAIDDLMAAAQNGKLEEVFGTGTAAVISPVGELRYKDQTAQVNSGEIGPLTKRLYDTLTGIQWGKIQDGHGWTVLVD